MSNPTTINATRITRSTLVGVMSEDFPLKGGNCFSVAADDGKEYRILNFRLENLEELFRRGLEWPVPIVVDEKWAYIHDERIGERWYQDRTCTTCAPRRLWSVTQQLSHDRNHYPSDMGGKWETCDYSNYKRNGILVPKL